MTAMPSDHDLSIAAAECLRAGGSWRWEYDGRPRRLDLPCFGTGHILVEWPNGGFLRLGSERGVAGAASTWSLDVDESDAQVATVRVLGDVRAQLLLGTRLSIEAHDADFAPQEGRLELSKCTLPGGITVSDVSYALDDLGDLVVNWRAALHFVRTAESVRISSVANSRIEVQSARRVTMHGVTLSVPRRAVLEEVAGEVTLRNCHGFVAGAPMGLSISDHAFADESPLDGAEMYRVRLPVKRTLDFLTAAVEATRLEPVGESVEEVVRHNDVSLEVCEKLYDVVKEKSADPAFSDLAAYWVLDARRRLTRPFSNSWWVLSLYRVVGYARRPGRAFLTWSGIGLAYMIWRGAVALKDPTGVLGQEQGIVIRELILAAVDVAALFFLLPLMTGGIDVRSLRLAPGALLFARVLETICLVALAAGIRNRLRVRAGRE